MSAAGDAVRIAGLKGTAISVKNRWQAAALITVADSSGSGAAGLTVTARWSDGRAFSGTTDAAGQVTANSALMSNKDNSISFRVENVDHPDYDPTLNSASDGVSDGTSSIIVYKDGTTAAGGFQVSNDDQDPASPGRPQDGRAGVTITAAADTDASGNVRESSTFAYQAIVSQFVDNDPFVALIPQGIATDFGVRDDRSDVTVRDDDTTGNNGASAIDAPQVVSTPVSSRSAGSSQPGSESRAAKSPLTSTVAEAVHDKAMLAFLAD